MDKITVIICVLLVAPVCSFTFGLHAEVAIIVGGDKTY